jgi:hypothetical protein
MEAVLERQQFLAAKGAPPDEWLSRFNADNDAIIDREFERIRSAAVLAPLVVGSAATEALKGLLNIWLDAQAKKLPDTEFAPLLRAALNRAATALTIAARQDLWRDSAGPGRPEAST